jgi:hypothetical protein
MASLPAPLREQSRQAIEKLTPVSPTGSISRPHTGLIEARHFTLTLDPDNGAIIKLANKRTGREWASKANPIALFTYQTLSQADYDRFIASYIVTTADWAFKDFGKPNIGRFGAQSQEWQPKLGQFSLAKTADGLRVLANLEIDDQEAFQSGRAAFPRQIYLELVLPDSEPVIHLNMSWFQKPATRLPEAMWLTFNPVAADHRGWSIDKSGEATSPFEVVASGNRHMHAVGRGFAYKEGPHAFTVESLDAPVIALGNRTPLGFSNDPPDLSKGIHSNLFNNAWGTNYIMWYGEDMRFRYVLRP